MSKKLIILINENQLTDTLITFTLEFRTLIRIPVQVLIA
jgi:hypothetical protein